MSRVIVSSVFCPPGRQGPEESLKFANGIIIEDEDPYFQIENQVKQDNKNESYSSKEEKDIQLIEKLE